MEFGMRKKHYKPNTNSRSHKGRTCIFDHIISFTFILTNHITRKGTRQMKAWEAY